MDLQEAAKTLKESAVKNREAEEFIMEHITEELREMGLEAELIRRGYAYGPYEIRIYLKLEKSLSECSAQYRAVDGKESEQ